MQENEAYQQAVPRSYVAIDIETTGLDPKTDKIIEIGAVLVQDAVAVEEKSTLVNPKRELTERIQELTGIRDSMLEHAPGIEEVIGEFAEFGQGLPLLGHNILFDYRFLKQAAVNQKLTYERSGIDTLYLCRKFMPPEEKKSLGNACTYFQVDLTAAHRALADAYGAHGLYQRLASLYGGERAEAFSSKTLIYKAKREQPASKRQKEVLHELIKYHRIDVTVQIDDLSRNEISRLTDKIISQYGTFIVKR